MPGWKQTPVPCPVLPPKASLSARAAEPEAGLCGADGAAGPGGWVWEVRDDDTGCVVVSYPEHDLRFSISCKVHVFPTRIEADQYHGVAPRATDPLDAQRLLRELVAGAYTCPLLSST